MATFGLSSVLIYLAYAYVEASNGFDLSKTFKANIEKCSGKPVTKLDVYQGNILGAGSAVLALSAYLGIIFKNKYAKVN